MELQSLLTRFKSVVECAFCKSDLKNPVLARCQHSFCDGCAADANKKSSPCPVCERRVKSRSVKKSSQLQAFVPLVKKLIRQTQIGLTFLEGITESNNGEKNAHCNKVGQENNDIPAVEITSPRKSHNNLHLWGRLLTASESTSDEGNEAEQRKSILQDDESQSVQSKVTSWLKSSALEQPNNDARSDVSDDLITDTAVGAPNCEQTPIHDNTAPKNNDDMVNEDTVFPKTKRLKTFSSKRKVNYVSARPPVLFDSTNDASSSQPHKTLKKSSRHVNDEPSVVKEVQIGGSDSADGSSTHTLTAKDADRPLVNGNRTDVIGDSVTSDQNLSKSRTPEGGTNVRHSLSHRMPVIDKISVTACGFVDIHSQQDDPSIVLRHLEKAMADIPVTSSSLNRNTKKYKNKKGHRVKSSQSSARKSIVHSTQDHISEIPDSQQSLGVPKKRRAQTGLRTRPSKRVSTRDDTESDKAKLIEDHLACDDDDNDGIPLLEPKRASSVSENDLAPRNLPIVDATERSTASDGLTAKQSTFLVSKPENWPASLKQAVVKIAKLKEDTPAPSSTNTTATDSCQERAATGRVVNIDLSQPQVWEQGVDPTNTDVEDIICCSWSESSKHAGENCHENGSENLHAKSTDQHSDNLWNEDNSVANYDRQYKLDMMPDKELTDNIARIFKAVISLDKEYLSKHFISSFPSILQAMDYCHVAVSAFEVECASKLREKSDAIPSAVSNHNSPSNEDVDVAGCELRSADHDSPARNSRLQDDRSEVNISMCAHSENLSPSHQRDEIVEADDVNSQMEQATPCDDLVTEKVQSWLNRLGEFEHEKGQRQRHLASQQNILPSSNGVSNTNKKKETGISTQTNGNSPLSQKDIERNADAITSRKRRPSPSSTSITNKSIRSVRSNVDPDPAIDAGNIQCQMNNERNFFDDSLDCDSELVAVTTAVSNERKVTSPPPPVDKAVDPVNSVYDKAKSAVKSRKLLDRKLVGYKIPRRTRSGTAASKSTSDRQAGIKELGFVTSGLHESDVKLVKAFANRYGGKHFDTFAPDTITHVIMKTTPKRSCDRTLKYLSGIACKKWVVSTKWITDSLLASEKLDEADYEILGDNCMKEFEYDNLEIPKGPTKSRLSVGYNLLERYYCYCIPPFSLITIDQTTRLLQYCGATVAKNLEEFRESIKLKSRHRLVIVDAENATDFPNYATIEKEYDTTVVSIEWIYESISRFHPEPVNKFSLATFTQDSNGI